MKQSLKKNENDLFDIIYSLLLSHILSDLPCSVVFVRDIDSLVTSCWLHKEQAEKVDPILRRNMGEVCQDFNIIYV